MSNMTRRQYARGAFFSYRNRMWFIETKMYDKTSNKKYQNEQQKTKTKNSTTEIVVNFCDSVNKE